MPRRETPQDVINSFRRRQQRVPIIIGGFAFVLILAALGILGYWYFGFDRQEIALFSRPTATLTITNTVTLTSTVPTKTATITETETVTPTITLTLTASGPFEYVVLEGDNCWDIATKFSVDVMVLLGLNNFGDGCPIKPGQKIMIPGPDQSMPTSTSVPANLPKGTKIEYKVQSDDSLESIASKFNSTVQDIMDLNKIVNANSIQVGQKIIVRVNLVTPTPTMASTSTTGPTPIVTPKK